MKRIWFKPDCVEWIKQGIKTTTWRTRKHEGEYEVVKGSWFKAEPIRLRVRLTPLVKFSIDELVLYHYDTEGRFDNYFDFLFWLKSNKLYAKGKEWWLHKIEVLNNDV